MATAYKPYDPNDCGRTKRIPKYAWEQHRPTILELYVESDLPMQEVVDVMAEQYGFHANVRQLRFMLEKTWRVTKNTPACAMRCGARKLHENPRRREFKYNNRVIPLHDFQRFESRHPTFNPTSSPTASTPSELHWETSSAEMSSPKDDSASDDETGAAGVALMEEAGRLMSDTTLRQSRDDATISTNGIMLRASYTEHDDSGTKDSISHEGGTMPLVVGLCSHLRDVHLRELWRTTLPITVITPHHEDKVTTLPNNQPGISFIPILNDERQYLLKQDDLGSLLKTPHNREHGTMPTPPKASAWQPSGQTPSEPSPSMSAKQNVIEMYLHGELDSKVGMTSVEIVRDWQTSTRELNTRLVAGVAEVLAVRNTLYREIYGHLHFNDVVIGHDLVWTCCRCAEDSIPTLIENTVVLYCPTCNFRKCSWGARHINLEPDQCFFGEGVGTAIEAVTSRASTSVVSDTARFNTEAMDLLKNMKMTSMKLSDNRVRVPGTQFFVPETGVRVVDYTL